MATAKALGGGVMPIGAITATADAWAGLIEAPFYTLQLLAVIN